MLEASIRMNMLSVTQQQDGTPEKPVDPSIMTTPYFDFCSCLSNPWNNYPYLTVLTS